MQQLESLYLTKVCPWFSFPFYTELFFGLGTKFLCYLAEISLWNFTHIKVIELRMSKPAVMATQEARPLREHFCRVYTQLSDVILGMATQEARPLREHFCRVYTQWVILFWELVIPVLVITGFPRKVFCTVPLQNYCLKHIIKTRHVWDHSRGQIGPERHWKWLGNYTIKTMVFQMDINTVINTNKVPESPYTEIEVKMKYICNWCDESI